MTLKFLTAMALTCCCRSLCYAAAIPAVVPDSAFLRPQSMIAVEHARRLNMFCIGAGKPVVILESGLGGGMVFWRHVMPQIGAFTRVCAYDRAGYGFSDPATRPSDATNAVDDLHRLLKAGGIPLPFVYVGHSDGGLYGMLFTANYPNEVAGMVLIDPSFAHQGMLMSKTVEAAERVTADANTVRAIADMKNCLSLARAGRLDPRKTKAASACIDTSGYPDRLDDALMRGLVRQWSLPATNAAYVSEFLSVT